MSIQSFKSGVDANIIAKAANPETITPIVIANAFKELADLNLEISVATGNGTGFVLSYTIAQIRATSGSTTLSGMFAISDKGRAGYFYVDSTDTTTTDDNGVVFVTSGGQRVKRIYTGPVDLAWFGLVDNDVSLANSINQVSIIATVLKANRYGSYYIGKGTYWVDVKPSPGAIEFPSNITLEMHPQCIIKARTSVGSNDYLFAMSAKENITIVGGQLVGARYQNTTTSEYGMGINIMSCKDINIKDVYISDCHGDGIYVSGQRSMFLNPKAPVSQLMQGIQSTTTGAYAGVPAGSWRCDVVGPGSVSFTVSGATTPFAVVTQATSRWIQTPYSSGSNNIQATITGSIEECRFDQPTYGMLIDNVKINNCRRNGVSLICVMNWTIKNCKFYNTNGTLPQAGIDLEPNVDTQRIWNGRLENVDSFDNLTQGFQITGNNIVMEGCNAFRNGNEGYYLSSANAAGGDMVMNNCTAYDNGSGIQIQKGEKVVISNMIIRNCIREFGIQVAGISDAVMNNVVIDGSFGYAFLITAGTKTKLTNIICKNVATGGANAGIYVRSSNCSIDNFIIKGAGREGLLTQAATGWANNTFSNGVVEDCQQNGISLGCNDSTLYNVTSQGNNISNGSSFYNVEIKGNNTKIALCTFKKGATSPRYGIKIQSTATNTMLLGNDFAGGGSTGNISNSGSGTVFTLPTT